MVAMLVQRTYSPSGNHRRSFQDPGCYTTSWGLGRLEQHTDDKLPADVDERFRYNDVAPNSRQSTYAKQIVEDIEVRLFLQTQL
jgi:hypothetical protein